MPEGDRTRDKDRGQEMVRKLEEMERKAAELEHTLFDNPEPAKPSQPVEESVEENPEPPQLPPLDVELPTIDVELPTIDVELPTIDVELPPLHDAVEGHLPGLDRIPPPPPKSRDKRKRKTRGRPPKAVAQATLWGDVKTSSIKEAYAVEVDGARFYTAYAVADLLKVSIRTVKRYVEQGALDGAHVGKRLYISELSVKRLLSRGNRGDSET